MHPTLPQSLTPRPEYPSPRVTPPHADANNRIERKGPAGSLLKTLHLLKAVIDCRSLYSCSLSFPSGSS